MQLINLDKMKNIKKYAPLLSFLLLYMFYAPFAMGFAKVSVSSLILYLIYILFCVFIPGQAIILYVDKKSGIELLFCESWMIGLSINILAFMLLKICHLDKYILTFFIVLAVTSVIAIMLIDVDEAAISIRQTITFLIVAGVF